MDTSEQYINMCRKATKLQEMWEPKEGDFYNREGYISGAYSEDYFKYVVVLHDVDKWKQEVVWLFRIDQLIALSNMPWQEFLFEVVEYSAGVSESAEIAALHSLMGLLYKKEWNGEDWILISENIN